MRDNVRVCVPRYLQIGKGSIDQLPEIIKIIGSIKSLLIVTDKQMVQFGYVKKLQDVLNRAGLKSNVFDDTVPDPTDKVVLNGINHLEKRSDEEWGDDPKYQEYKKNTPILLPFYGSK